MAYSKITDARYKEEKDVVTRLSNFKTDFDFIYFVNCSGVSGRVEVNLVKRRIFFESLRFHVLNGVWQYGQWDFVAESKVGFEIKAAMRGYVVLTKDKNCDEYVILGGARQSEVLAQQQQTREENRKAAEEKKKADGGKDASN